MPSKAGKRKSATTDDAKETSKKAKTAAPKSKKEESNKTDAPVAYTKWLIKSEPESRLENGVDVKFSFDDLKDSENSTACWDGVRNYQARNFMRVMKVGHEALFYHSNTKPPGVIGIVEVVKEAYPDHTQFDKKDPHYDPSSSKDNPRWDMVDVKYIRPTKRYIPLPELKELHLEHKQSNGPLANIALFTKARLSVQPLTDAEWDFILSLENKKA